MFDGTPVRPGDLIAERFEILHFEGAGGMGVVYRAHDRHTGKQVAFKILREGRESLTDRFAQEIQLLSGLRHRHLVGYVTHGETADGTPFLVMPWLDGHDLEKRLRSGRLSVQDALTLAGRVAEALGYLHGSGLVHRDLKPSNLFLPGGRIEEVQIIDLGIARTNVAARPVTLSGIVLGTPGFIAPEQALERGEILPAADIFSFGCVLFECLTGKRLFHGTHVMAVLARILVEEAPDVRELRPEVPEGLAKLLARMLAKRPEQRPSDGRELARCLADLHQAAPGAPPSLTSSERRVASVLVIDAGKESTHPTSSLDLRSGDRAFDEAAARFGVRVHAIDAHMAIALAPDTLEPQDQAAVLARFGRQVARAHPQCRVALATGNAAGRDRLPVGDAIDRGVSIVRVASAGHGVHVDELTAALITSRFDLKRVGGNVVVLDERVSLDPTRPLLGKPTSCVGRDRELALLQALVAECISEPGPKVAVVTAPAGAGKSRLRHELVRRMRRDQSAYVRVLACRGDPLHQATPYAQLAQAVRQHVGLEETQPPDEIRARLAAHVQARVPPGDAARVSAFLGELVGTPFDDANDLVLRAARQSADSMADHVRLALEDLVQAWLREQPILLVLEDLHWCDGASVKLVDALLGKARGAPLLVLALARPEVHQRFPDLWGRRHPTEIRLPPLSKKACETLVRESLGEGISAERVADIVERSEGNAFYLEELIREAADRSSAPGPRSARGREPLPETVLAIAQSRLERLDPVARRVLRAASIFGEAFSAEGVRALVPADPATITRTLTVLIEEEAIAPSEEPGAPRSRELVFRHVLLRAAAYATLTDEDRALGHKIAAQWLQSIGEDQEVVAMHWLEAHEPTVAAALFDRAARERLLRAQAEAAARCAIRAMLIGDLSLATIGERTRLLARTLEASRRLDAGDAVSGIENHLSAPEDRRKTGADLVRFAIERALAALPRSDDGPKADAMILASAATALGALGDIATATRLHGEAAGLAAEIPGHIPAVQYLASKLAFWTYEFPKAAEILSNAILPEDARERIQMLLILASATVAADARDALARGLDCIARAEALLPALDDDPLARAHCAKARVLCFGFAGEYTLALETAQQAVVFARQTGLRYEECAHLNNTGEAHLRLRNLEAARAAFSASIDLAIDIEASHIQLLGELHLAYIDGDKKRLANLSETFRASGQTMHECNARYWLGRLLSAQDPATARRELTRAQEIARELHVKIFVDECMEALSVLPEPPSGAAPA